MYPKTLKVWKDGSFQLLDGIYVTNAKHGEVSLPCGFRLFVPAPELLFLLQPTHTEGFLLQGPLDTFGVPDLGDIEVTIAKPSHRILLYLQAETYKGEFLLTTIGEAYEDQDAVPWLFHQDNFCNQKQSGLCIVEPTQTFAFTITENSFSNTWTGLTKDTSTGKPIISVIPDYYKTMKEN